MKHSLRSTKRKTKVLALKDARKGATVRERKEITDVINEAAALGAPTLLAMLLKIVLKDRITNKCEAATIQLAIELVRQKVNAAVWKKPWVVHCEPVGTGETALKYLAPYIFRVAISNNRIVALDEGQVTFKYKEFCNRSSQVLVGHR